MMTERTLGSVVKEARNGARMTQRELAAALGIKATHVAIENSRRKPSISLINRLAETLTLSGKELLVLAHPEAKQIVDEDSAGKRSAADRGAIWQRFASNGALLKGHAISPAELKMLRQVSMLSHIAHPGHFIFILNAIRQAEAAL
jgi:transcriptional regulator with XRE-family HTH domain